MCRPIVEQFYTYSRVRVSGKVDVVGYLLAVVGYHPVNGSSIVEVYADSVREGYLSLWEISLTKLGPIGVTWNSGESHVGAPLPKPSRGRGWSSVVAGITETECDATQSDYGKVVRERYVHRPVLCSVDYDAASLVPLIPND